MKHLADSWDTRDTRDSRDSRDSQDSLDTRDSRDTQDSRDSQDTLDSRCLLRFEKMGSDVLMFDLCRQSASGGSTDAGSGLG